MGKPITVQSCAYVHPDDIDLEAHASANDIETAKDKAGHSGQQGHLNRLCERGQFAPPKTSAFVGLSNFPSFDRNYAGKERTNTSFGYF
jgi:hypothetical protein